jgi:hypothetical protein
MSTIDHYLAELRTALRFHILLRRRLLTEAEAHLREAAETSSEREAVARFGDPSLVAQELTRGAAPSALSRASLLLLGVLALFVLPLYAIPENTLPPAPWAERPDYLTWKLAASLGAFAVALTAAVFALATAWRGWTRLSSAGLGISGTSLAVSGLLTAILTVQWAQAAPETGTTVALVLPTTVLALLAAAGAVATAAVYALPKSERVAVRG